MFGIGPQSLQCLCRYSSASISLQPPAVAKPDGICSVVPIKQQPSGPERITTFIKSSLPTNWFRKLQKLWPLFSLSSQQQEDPLVNSEHAADTAPQTEAHTSTTCAVTKSLSHAMHSQTSEQQESAHKPLQNLRSTAYQAGNQQLYYAKRHGWPQPCMQIIRRSALRWQIHWHGFIWPHKKELAIDLDRHY